MNYYFFFFLHDFSSTFSLKICCCRFDSPNPVQSVTPTPTPPPQRQPTPQSSTPLQQQVPAPQDSTFPPNRYGNQPPAMMPQGHMSGPPHDPYGHQNFPPHQQGYSTPNKMMGGGPTPDQYGGYPPQYQNYPNQRPPMMNDMNRGMYNTPNKRFPDQYPNQGEISQHRVNPMMASAGIVVVLELLCLVYCQFIGSQNH